MSKRLAELLPENIRPTGDFADLSINGITLDSRQVQEGYLFIAIQGYKLDGAQYINEAIKKGAVAILTYKAVEVADDVCLIVSPQLAQIVGEVASNFYSKRQPDFIAAVTGTNGKSSVVNFCKQIWDLLNIKSASLGTLGFDSALELKSVVSLTTPDVIKIHEILANLKANKINYLALEASSHGLQQGRLNGIMPNVVGFTNFSRDHLDYHHDLDAYFKAKSLLFTDIANDNTIAVLNADDDRFSELENICKKRDLEIVSYGRNSSEIKLLNIEVNVISQEFSFAYKGQTYQAKVNLTGEFQIYNILCAMAIIHASGIAIEEILAILPNIKSVSGRLERVEVGNTKIFIDFAHTPAALQNVLQILKNQKHKRLILVFGCGGERDKGKRQEMGKIADQYADITIITDDNPRHEDAASIRQEIMLAMNNPKEIAGRKKAIEYALEILEEGDILLIAGKGHEKYQIIGDQSLPFSDKEVVITHF
jgi:UDP-N-acetylmuramoyl-L-alanyl-D-glutamate--2,6-diaminopimelate ligase